MSHVIRLSSELYARLESHAQGFDNPVNVIERLLNSYEGVKHEPIGKSTTSLPEKDFTKFSFNNVSYGKGRLVLAVMKAYVINKPDVSFGDLLTTFPKHIQGSQGVFSKHELALSTYDRTGYKRHFLKPEDLIELSDGTIAVSREWGKGNINKFIQKAELIGFSILPVTE
jgi:hypothetical protein